MIAPVDQQSGDEVLCLGGDRIELIVVKVVFANHHVSHRLLLVVRIVIVKEGRGAYREETDQDGMTSSLQRVPRSVRRLRKSNKFLKRMKMNLRVVCSR